MFPKESDFAPSADQGKQDSRRVVLLSVFKEFPRCPMQFI